LGHQGRRLKDPRPEVRRPRPKVGTGAGRRKLRLQQNNGSQGCGRPRRPRQGPETRRSGKPQTPETQGRGWAKGGSQEVGSEPKAERRSPGPKAGRLEAGRLEVGGWGWGQGGSQEVGSEPKAERRSPGPEAEGRKVGGWRLAAGGWRLAAGGWRLAAGGWRLSLGFYRNQTPTRNQPHRGGSGGSAPRRNTKEARSALSADTGPFPL
jgi:hypothetical protein